MPSRVGFIPRLKGHFLFCSLILCSVEVGFKGVLDQLCSTESRTAFPPFIQAAGLALDQEPWVGLLGSAYLQRSPGPSCPPPLEIS